MVWKWGQPLGQVRWLTLLLICSGSLNILVVATLLYTHLFSSRPAQLTYSWRPAAAKEQVALPSNVELVRELKTASRYQLIQKLLSRKPVENGFAERDLALGCLIALHHFDLQRALRGEPKEVRSLTLPEGVSLPLYPALTPGEWCTLSNFALQEEWPLTPEGLFAELHKIQGDLPASLETALTLTPHFRAVEILLSRATPPATRAQIVTLLRQGEWSTLNRFTEEQRSSQELSDERRRHLLTTLFNSGSQLAGRLLLRSDGPYILHRWSDGEVVDLLQKLGEPSAEGHAFAFELLKTPRSSAVLKAAAALLSGETVEEVKIVPVKEERMHVVQKGESLWLLARRYSCSVDDLVQLNQLRSETISVGQKLRLP